MLAIGATAPEILLPNVHGEVVSLASQYARPEEPVLVVLFKVSCPTCQLVLPLLERLWKARGQVLGISQDGAPATKDFGAHFQLTFPILLDAAPYPVSQAFGITNVPSLFLVRENKEIVWTSMGFERSEIEELGHLLHTAILRTTDKLPERKPG